MSRDPNVILGHAADNDGIEEYDNRLPEWWVGMFAFSVLWGIGYAVDYHLVSERSQAGFYELEMAAAAERWPQSGPAVLAFDPASVDAGQAIFLTTCASCHGPTLTGGIGPSLVDATWIHGNEPEQVQATITSGVTTKGMPAWGPILGPDKVAKVTAFVVTAARAGGTSGPAPTVAATGGDAVADAGTPGEQVYKQNCLACHGDRMQGLVGPSLSDDVWIHGGSLADITRTITVGVPEKGMVSWGPILGPEKIAAVAEFVHQQNASASASP